MFSALRSILKKRGDKDLARPLLYQLSYSHLKQRLAGFEPTTRCSPAGIRHGKRKGDDKGLARDFPALNGGQDSSPAWYTHGAMYSHRHSPPKIKPPGLDKKSDQEGNAG